MPSRIPGPNVNGSGPTRWPKGKKSSPGPRTKGAPCSSRCKKRGDASWPIWPRVGAPSRSRSSSCAPPATRWRRRSVACATRSTEFWISCTGRTTKPGRLRWRPATRRGCTPAPTERVRTSRRSFVASRQSTKQVRAEWLRRWMSSSPGSGRALARPMPLTGPLLSQRTSRRTSARPRTSPRCVSRKRPWSRTHWSCDGTNCCHR